MWLSLLFFNSAVELCYPLLVPNLKILNCQRISLQCIAVIRRFGLWTETTRKSSTTGRVKIISITWKNLEAFPLDAFSLNTFPLEDFFLDTFPLDTLPLNTFLLNTYPLNTFPLATCLPDICSSDTFPRHFSEKNKCLPKLAFWTIFAFTLGNCPWDICPWDTYT